MPGTYRSFIASLVLFGLGAGAVSAKTLEVGPNAEFKKPSDAIAAAAEGDTVNIAPGQYFDCATIGQNELTIQGSGPGAIMTDKPCGGKALLIEHGSKIVIRNMTLQRARVPDGNGAAIRYEGGNLTIENVKFINNQDGILGAPDPAGTVHITGSEFLQNGTCAGACAHGIYFDRLALLHVEKSKFFETKEGHGIKSRALKTEVIDCDISDGANGTMSYLIDIPNGGSLTVRNSRLEKGPHAGNQAYAITIGEEGVDQPTEELVFEKNTFTNDQNRGTTFVRNLTATPAELTGNTVKGQVRPLEGDGATK